jgi:hypothetical protein
MIFLPSFVGTFAVTMQAPHPMIKKKEFVFIFWEGNRKDCTIFSEIWTTFIEKFCPLNNKCPRHGQLILLS